MTDDAHALTAYDYEQQPDGSWKRKGATGGDAPIQQEVPEAAGPQVIRLADVQREEVAWRWQGRIPQGKLTLLAGDPGVGKSFLSAAVACAVTTGAPLPGDSDRHDPAHVLILTAEDGLADTLRPRLEDMGTDLSRVTALNAIRNADGQDQHVDLTTDLPHLENVLSTGGYGLVIIDPITAYLGGALSTQTTAGLRAVLTPLSMLAERRGVAVLAITHLRKSSGDRALYRVIESISYTAAARVVHLVGVDPDNEQRRVMATVKCNLAPLAKSLSFEVTDGRFLWGGESDVSAAALVGPESTGEERSEREEVMAFLREVLAEGPLPAQEVQSAAEALGYKSKQLRGAREAMGVHVRPLREHGKSGIQAWFWSLDALDAHTEKRASKPSFESRGAEPDGSAGHLNISTCHHRPAGEADDLWALGASTWGDDPRMCPCCAGPVKGELGDEDGRCPTCIAGCPAPAKGGHLIRFAQDLGEAEFKPSARLQSVCSTTDPNRESGTQRTWSPLAGTTKAN